MKSRIMSIIMVIALVLNSNITMASTVFTHNMANTMEKGENIKIASVSLGEDNCAAVTTNGDLYCWGNNFYGVVGNGKSGEREYQATPVKVLSNVSSVSLNSGDCAAITKNGDLYCWGDNYFGQVGNGKSGEREYQATPVKVLSNVSSVSLFGSISAAVTTNGDLYCWGFNRYGEVGNGKSGISEKQTTPMKVLSNVSSVSLSGFISAAVTTNGDLYCWGRNFYGQVGNGTKVDQTTPVKVLSNVSSVSLGENNSVAITTNGDLYCWGANYYGQVGNGTKEDQVTPVKVLSNVSSVSVGSNCTAITTNRDLYCWGYNYYGQVGNGKSGERECQTTPMKVLSNVSSVSVGSNCTAITTTNGDLYCWGYNGRGEVGNGTKVNQVTPVKVLSNVSSVSHNLYGGYSAVITTNGELYCWGWNRSGVIGNGRSGVSEYQLTPVKVFGNITSNNLEKKLQCSSFSTVEVGHSEILNIKAYEDSLEKLKSLTDNIIWKSDNPKIAKVENKGYVHSSSSIKYNTEEGSYKIWEAVGIVYIKGISEGTTKIIGTALDGSEVSCQVTVTQSDDSKNNEMQGNGGSLILGEQVSGSVGDSVKQFFPANWSLKSSIFPVEISKSLEEDGSYKIKGTVGIGRADWLNDETKWNTYKTNVSDANKYTGKIDCLKSYKDTWGVKSITAVSTDKFEFLPELSVMGYFENTYDKNGNLISTDDGLAADTEWSGSINWQFVTPIGPVYLNLNGSGKLSGNLGTKYDYNKKSLDIINGSLELTPSVTLEGGYGIDKVATIGAQGELSVPITIVPASKGEVEASAAIHLKLVFVLDYTNNLASYKKTIWDTSSQRKKAKNSNIVQLSDGKISEMDTSFAELSSDWNGNTVKKKLKTLGKSIADTITNRMITLQEGILPSSLPMQVQFAGKNVMIFQTYDKSRTTLNSTVLKYSVLENGVWSEPNEVLNDGYADMYADMKVVNGKLVLVWQKMKKEITGNVEINSKTVLKDIASNSEIYFSTFDDKTNTFTLPIRVTDNSKYDMMPRICNDSDDIIVSWVRNDKADIMQESGVNKIYTAKWNGSSFGKENVLSQAPGTIDDYIVFKNAEGIQTIYAGQSNGITALFDTNGQVNSNLMELMTVSEDGTISSLNYEDGTVNCISKGKLYAYNILNGKMVSSTAGESTFGSSVQYCSNGEKRGCIWSSYDEETGIGRILASMKTETGYSEPITICEKANTMWRYFSSTIDSDGNWQIVANALDTKSNINSLQYVTKKQESKLELAGASINENDVVDGLTAVNYFVKNTEDTTIHNIEIELMLADGSRIKKTVPVTLLPGESEAGTAYMDLKDVDAEQNVKLSVLAENQTDKSDCVVTDKIGYSDISVDAVSSETADKVNITATLKNLSSVNTNVALHLYSDEKKTVELQKQVGIVMKAKSNTEIQFTVKKKDITYNENQAAYITLNVAAENGDYNEDNNTAYIIVYKEKTPSITTTPTPLPNNNQGDEPIVKSKIKVGSTFNKSKVKYTIIKMGKNSAVEYSICNSNDKNINIPEKVSYKGVKYMVTSVGNKAFYKNTKLKKIVLGKNIKKIGNKAFYQCKKLRYIIVKTNKLTKKNFGKAVFAKCHLAPRVKTSKKVWRKYYQFMTNKGKLSKGAVFYY